MADSMQLSNDVMNNIFEILVRHDPAVEKDLMVGLQYLSAITGYFAAEYPGDEHERDDLLQQLSAFMRHVSDDRVAMLKQQQAQQPAQSNSFKGKCVPTDHPAVGVWTPE